MPDKFFTQSRCDRCGGLLADGRTMSRFNEDCICMKCSEAERSLPEFKQAVSAEHEQIKAGNYNFKGIGYPENK